MSFSENTEEVVYILVSININEVNKMDSDHYYCYVLYYNTGIWWRCDDDNILELSGYTDNVYYESSHEDIDKK